MLTHTGIYRIEVPKDEIVTKLLVLCLLIFSALAICPRFLLWNCRLVGRVPNLDPYPPFYECNVKGKNMMRVVVCVIHVTGGVWGELMMYFFGLHVTPKMRFVGIVKKVSHANYWLSWHTSGVQNQMIGSLFLQKFQNQQGHKILGTTNHDIAEHVTLLCYAWFVFAWQTPCLTRLPWCRVPAALWAVPYNNWLNPCRRIWMWMGRRCATCSAGWITLVGRPGKDLFQVSRNWCHPSPQVWQLGIAGKEYPFTNYIVIIGDCIVNNDCHSGQGGRVVSPILGILMNWQRVSLFVDSSSFWYRYWRTVFCLRISFWSFQQFEQFFGMTG